MKDLKIPISKMRLRLICWDNYTTSPETIHLFCTGIGNDNSFVYVMVVSWYLLAASLIGLASVYLRGTRYPPHGLLWPHHRGPPGGGGPCLKNLNDKPAAWGVNHIRDVHFGMVVCNINLSNSWLLPRYIVYLLKTKGRQFDNIVVTGGTVHSHYISLITWKIMTSVKAIIWK